MFVRLEKIIVLSAAAIIALSAAVAVHRWSSSHAHLSNVLAIEADQVKLEKHWQSLHRLRAHEKEIVADLRERRITLKSAAEAHREILEEHFLLLNNRWEPPTANHLWWVARLILETTRGSVEHERNCDAFERLQELEAELSALAESP